MADLHGQAITVLVRKNGQSTGSQLREPAIARALEITAFCETYQTEEVLDEEIFGAIATATLCPEEHPELYTSYTSQRAVAQVEQEIAQEIVNSYKQLKLRQRQAFVQKLNQLLQ